MGMHYRAFLDSVVVLCLVIYLSAKRDVYERHNASDSIMLLLSLMLAMDVLCKLFICGFKPYFKRTNNLLDFMCSSLLLVSSVALIENIVNGNDQVDGFVFLSRITLVIRAAIGTRNIPYLCSSFEMQPFGRTIRRILKSLASLTVTFTCFTYGFILIGVLCFGGLINKDPDRPQYQVIILLACIF